ncbi:Crinkler (CRN) [Phytophthora megakarya]|uniref:Crinkler (CRN) n=1 Tax=Phytophthora megakarya TaxID=4795 RepID=A0A225WF97_9STRA|nr:Crinkler (CRN) [Phytophthora megakarya]
MVKLELLCALVGAQGSVFSVTIYADMSVGTLKEAIKKANSNDLKHVDARKLQLFLTNDE